MHGMLMHLLQSQSLRRLVVFAKLSSEAIGRVIDRAVALDQQLAGVHLSAEARQLLLGGVQKVGVLLKSEAGHGFGDPRWIRKVIFRQWERVFCGLKETCDFGRPAIAILMQGLRETAAGC